GSRSNVCVEAIAFSDLTRGADTRKVSYGWGAALTLPTFGSHPRRELAPRVLSRPDIGHTHAGPEAPSRIGRDGVPRVTRGTGSEGSCLEQENSRDGIKPGVRTSEPLTRPQHPVGLFIGNLAVHDQSVGQGAAEIPLLRRVQLEVLEIG